MHEAIVTPFYVNDYDRLRWNFDEVEVMQFTGALDIDGAELWEGDIVDLYPDDERLSMEGVKPECRTTLIWHDGSGYMWSAGWFFARKIQKFESFNVDSNNRVWYARRVGNIYENPELLNT